MGELNKDLNVYGHNLPEERGTGREGIREKGTAEDLDDIRHQREGEGGGMGREQTPRESNPQGEWHHDDSKMEHAVDPKPELDETPMPPRNAPLSDEIPS